MQLDTQALSKLVHAILVTSPSEITCVHCYDLIDRYVEIELSGKSAAEALPMVQAHLLLCRDCREEYQALVIALRSLTEGDTSP